jgi:hypothetical protein
MTKQLNDDNNNALFSFSTTTTTSNLSIKENDNDALQQPSYSSSRSKSNIKRNKFLINKTATSKYKRNKQLSSSLFKNKKKQKFLHFKNQQQKKSTNNNYNYENKINENNFHLNLFYQNLFKFISNKNKNNNNNNNDNDNDNDTSPIISSSSTITITTQQNRILCKYFNNYINKDKKSIHSTNNNINRQQLIIYLLKNINNTNNDSIHVIESNDLNKINNNKNKEKTNNKFVILNNDKNKNIKTNENYVYDLINILNCEKEDEEEKKYFNDSNLIEHNNRKKTNNLFQNKLFSINELNRNILNLNDLKNKIICDKYRNYNLSTIINTTPTTTTTNNNNNNNNNKNIEIITSDWCTSSLAKQHSSSSIQSEQGNLQKIIIQDTSSNTAFSKQEDDDNLSSLSTQELLRSDSSFLITEQTSDQSKFTISYSSNGQQLLTHSNCSTLSNFDKNCCIVDKLKTDSLDLTKRNFDETSNKMLKRNLLDDHHPYLQESKDDDYSHDYDRRRQSILMSSGQQKIYNPNFIIDNDDYSNSPISSSESIPDSIHSLQSSSELSSPSSLSTSFLTTNNYMKDVKPLVKKPIRSVALDYYHYLYEQKEKNKQSHFDSLYKHDIKNEPVKNKITKKQTPISLRPINRPIISCQTDSRCLVKNTVKNKKIIINEEVNEFYTLSSLKSDSTDSTSTVSTTSDSVSINSCSITKSNDSYNNSDEMIKQVKFKNYGLHKTFDNSDSSNSNNNNNIYYLNQSEDSVYEKNETESYKGRIDHMNNYQRKIKPNENVYNEFNSNIEKSI